MVFWPGQSKRAGKMDTMSHNDVWWERIPNRMARGAKAPGQEGMSCLKVAKRPVSLKQRESDQCQDQGGGLWVTGTTVNIPRERRSHRQVSE
jgi:hypothetical protein